MEVNPAEPIPIVLLPGLDGTGLLFQPLVDALPPTFRPIIVRYPVDRVMGYDALADEVARQLPTPSRFLLLGESFGGPLAILLAARRPPGLAALVRCATFASSPHPVLGPVVRPFVGPWPFRLYPAWKRLCPGTWAHAAEVSQLVRPNVIADRVRAVLSVDVRPALAACPVPILCLRATRDWLVPAGNLRRIQWVRSDVTVESIRSPHQVLQTCPTAAAAAIERFVDGIMA